MRRKRLVSSVFAGLLAAVVAGAWIPSARANPVEIVDDLGNTIRLEQPARRIVPLYGAFMEMLYAVGAGPQVIARTRADRFPEQVLALPSVGTHMRPNVEMILGLKPDLIVQSASRRTVTPEMDRLAAAGIPVAVFSPRTFEGVFSTMNRLGVLTGRRSESREAVAGLKRRLQAVRERLEGESRRPSVFFEVRAEPLAAAGTGSIVNEIVAAAGGENAIRVDRAIVKTNFEFLLLQDPDFYVVQRGPMNKSPVAPVERPHFERLQAVREGRVLWVDEFLFSRPGPRCVEAVEQLAAELHPGR